MPDFSLIIPSRNERHLGRTVENILENTNKNTEIVVVLDGWVPEPNNKPEDNRVRYLQNSDPIGQRQSINKAARTCDSRWLGKTDAHVAVSKDIDLILMRDHQPNWLFIPRMYNLNVTTWEPKLHKRTDYMYISSPWAEKPFRSQYFEGKEKDDYRYQPKSDKIIDDTLTMMGPFYFMTFDKFWEFGGEDENHGGWGMQAIEWSLKFHLSNNYVKVHKGCWFAHYFRGGGVPEGEKAGFPYRITNKEVNKARAYSQDLWLNDKWPLAKRKLEDVIKQFDPPGWSKDMPKGRWYQEATIKGRKMPTERKNDTSEKRWKQYIEPLLKPDSGRFIDLGCNAGFYCRKAIDLGYKAIGVEYDKTYIEHARYWEKEEPKGLEIIEKDIRDYEIPLASVVLMANIHYWLPEEDLKILIDQLLRKTLQVIVIGRHSYAPVHASRPDISTLMGLFKGWTMDRAIKGKKHYSVLFKNPKLKEVNTNEFFELQQPSKSHKFYPSFKKMIETGDTEDYREYLKWRKFKNPESIVYVHDILIKSIKEKGILNPLLVEGNKLVDGDHRLICAKVLGIDKIIVKEKEDNDIMEGWQKYR